MGTGLHGRGALFDTEPPGLAARLTGLRPYQHISSPFEHPREPPFVVFAGVRGIGKSAVLQELRAAYKGHTPVALIDGEEAQFDRPPPHRPAHEWAPVSQAVLTIAEQLAEPVTGAGRIHFPRLASGLIAVAAGDWSDRDLPRIREEAERILLLNGTGSGVAGFAGRWVGKVVAKMVSATSTGTGSVVEPVIEATWEAVGEGLSATHRRLRRGASWYQGYPNAGGNPKLGLILLSGHSRSGGDPRTHAERYLVRALLADLQDAYAGVVRRTRRLGRPVVLIDNVQEPAVCRLMESVLRDRAGGRADQVVFFAALRRHRHPALRHAVRRTLPEVAGNSGWQPAATPSTRALLVALPPLTADNTLHLVDAACPGLPLPPHLPRAIQRLTGGNPLGVTLTAASARQNLPRGSTSLGALLTADVQLREDHDQRPAYREILDRLVPGDRLDELTVLAAAHDRDSAFTLAKALLPADFGAPDVLGLQARLAEEGHPAAPGHFVGDPFVRTLLLLRLHHQDPGHRTWRAAHRTLIDHYGDAEDHVRYRVYHELSLGDVDLAVSRLRDAFHRLHTRSWLSALVYVASAPYHPAHAPGGRSAGDPSYDDRAAVALGHTDAAQLPPQGVDAALHLRVRRLLYAVWQLTDPLVLPDAKVTERLRWELEQLSDQRSAGTELLWHASRDWPEDALAGRPLRVPGGDAGGA
ncbi:hypothetical protein [Streptomyces poonensis]|uniref:Uncharacterized protein n=1 Tax=Streptomyces poonensis TaxID=68255 RepID=A0A918PLW0_9ACTN|nr:hypothetical protein [Streptomyces poonensis]GGZ15437.1 hypothetical protein GCM10010365_38970 [Streptomyces poonensis]GLJ91500.1 hypothetical protein GCM10017589_41070 [Streptomyces poonensis]